MTHAIEASTFNGHFWEVGFPCHEVSVHLSEIAPFSIPCDLNHKRRAGMKIAR